MLKGQVPVNQAEPPPQETEEVVHLHEVDLKAIVKTLMDLCYDSGKDIYECPSALTDLAEELDVI